MAYAQRVGKTSKGSRQCPSAVYFSIHFALVALAVGGGGFAGVLCEEAAEVIGIVKTRLAGAMFAPPFTARDIERHVKEIIRLHKDSGTFMFGVADQVPPNGDLALVKLVSDLVEEYGRY